MFDRSQRYLFEDLVRDTQTAETDEALFALLQRDVGQYGYDRLIFSILHDPDLPPEYNRHGIFHVYPEDWQKDYVETDYGLIDPVMHAGATHTAAFTWKDLEDSTSLTSQQTRFLRMAEEAGLNSGIGVPIRSQNGLAGVGLAATIAHDGGSHHLDLLNAMCTQTYLAFRRLHARPGRTVILSPKETEILTWVAAGKTDEDIAAILGISRNTVDTHMRHIFRKLDATNRVTAVVTGLTQGHIRP
jgi:LuxR family quorum sensing-dependent transcriptional regulator